MKPIITFIIFIIFHFSVFADDNQAISDQAYTDSKILSSNIKSNLTQVISLYLKMRNAKEKMDKNPSEYNPVLIKEEWDSVLDELRRGKFCKGCHKSKKQLEKQGIDFYSHTAENGGTVSARPEDYAHANSVYSPKYEEAVRVQSEFLNSREERKALLWDVYAYKANELRNKIQTAYDFQLRVYLSDKQNAKKGIFYDLSDDLIKSNDLLKELPEGSPEYDRVNVIRYKVIDDMDFNVNLLNQNRIQIIKKADIIKLNLYEKLTEIRNLVSQTGDDEDNPIILLDAKFNFSLTRDTYMSVRLQDSLASFIDSNIFTIYKDVKATSNK